MSNAELPKTEHPLSIRAHYHVDTFGHIAERLCQCSLKAPPHRYVCAVCVDTRANLVSSAAASDDVWVKVFNEIERQRNKRKADFGDRIQGSLGAERLNGGLDALSQLHGTLKVLQRQSSAPAPSEDGADSPILAFDAWLTRYVADNGRKLTQTEYGIAYAAFIAAHPSEGPQSHVMVSEDGAVAATREVLRLIHDRYVLTFRKEEVKVCPECEPCGRFTTEPPTLREDIAAIISKHCSADDAEKQCIWTYNLDEYWQTSCGDQFCISEGTPAENNMRFCHYCGLRIEESK